MASPLPSFATPNINNDDKRGTSRSSGVPSHGLVAVSSLPLTAGQLRSSTSLVSHSNDASYSILCVERELNRQLEEVKGQLRASLLLEKELKLQMEQQHQQHIEALARESTAVR
jgi:hypothetical protein